MSLLMCAAVGFGGALGYNVSGVLGDDCSRINGSFATLSSNMVGRGLIGLFACLIASGLILPKEWCGFIAIDLLGEPTTIFSLAVDSGIFFCKLEAGMAVFYFGLTSCTLLCSFSVCYWLLRMLS